MLLSCLRKEVLEIYGGGQLKNPPLVSNKGGRQKVHMTIRFIKFGPAPKIAHLYMRREQCAALNNQLARAVTLINQAVPPESPLYYVPIIQQLSDKVNFIRSNYCFIRNCFRNKSLSQLSTKSHGNFINILQ